MTKKPSGKVYRASVYLRLSKEDGDVASGSRNESNSIANQKSLILDYLKDKPDIQVVSIQEDDGYSGVLTTQEIYGKCAESVVSVLYR